MKYDTDKWFADWKFNINGKIEQAEVRFVSHGSTDEFTAICKPEGKPEIICINPDLNKLRKEVGKRLTESFKIEWQHKLHIELNSSFSEMTEAQPENEHVRGTLLPWKAEIQLEIRTAQIALDRNGKKIYRYNSGEGYASGWPDEGPPEGDKSWTDKDMRALIDDTPENRTALQKIIEGFKTLNQRLSEVLHPDKIQGALNASHQNQKWLTFSEKPGKKK